VIRSIAYAYLRYMVLAVLFVATVAIQEARAALKVLPLGDSLTYGVGELGGGTDVSVNEMGYRRYLQEMLWESGVDYDFLGGFGAGRLSPFDPDAPIYTGQTMLTNSRSQTRELDLDHFGWPGAKALGGTGQKGIGRALYYTLPAYFPVPVSPSTRDKVLNPHSNLKFAFDANNTQDVVVYGGLIQQIDAGAGTDFVGPNPGFAFDAAAVAASSNPDATTDWIPQVPDVVLLHVGTNSLNILNTSPATAATQLEQLLGALERDWRDGLIAADAKILLADIVPKASSKTDREVESLLVDYSFQYNELIDDAIATRGEDFASLIRRVNMFEIEITPGLLDTLGLDDDTLLNPDPTDNFVDWVTGDYNESTNLGSITGPNTNLFGTTDFIHPAALGYRLMAYQWFQELKKIGVVPEPSSLVLLGWILLGLSVSRERRAVPQARH